MACRVRDRRLRARVLPRPPPRRRTSPACASTIRRSSSSRGTSRPKTSVGCRVSPLHSVSRLGCSDSPMSTSSSARTTRRRSLGWTRIAAGGSRSASSGMGALGPQTVVEALPTLAVTGRRRRQVGDGGAEIEAGPAHDDGRSSVCQRLVDGAVRERLILDDGGLVIELPDGDELRRSLWLGGEDGQPAVHLHRVGGDELGRDAVRDRSATAVLPDAVGPKIASTSGATPRRAPPGCPGGSATWKRDPDRDQLAALADPEKFTVMLRRVRPRSSEGSVRLAPSTSTSSQGRRGGVSLGRDALNDLHEPLDALALQVIRHLIGHRRGLGAAARRVDECERAVEADLLDGGDRSRRSRRPSRRGSRR